MESPTHARRVVVRNPNGLHARPANLLVKTALRFVSKIELIKDSERVDGKSILSVLTLAAEHGTELSIEATGSDAEEALEALEELFASSFAIEENSSRETAD